MDDGMGAPFEYKNKIVQGEKQFTPVIHPDMNELYGFVTEHHGSQQHDGSQHTVVHDHD